MKQATEFLRGEADAWMQRNQGKYNAAKDPVIAAIRQYRIVPKDILEIGCADGARLDSMEGTWICATTGIDPGCKSTWPSRFRKGTARTLPCDNDEFDMVIYGWCLYLCDPQDYFQIVSEGDRVLEDGGYLIVYDFHADYPYKTPYKHKEGLFSHHYDFSKLWLSHPAYSLYGRTIHGETSVTILKKNLETAFPVQK